ncbi:MAG: haloacid dehalogenase [Porticoccaceae bacterium]
MPDLKSLLSAIPIGAKTSPGRGERRVRAVFFDTYGTVCDFYGPLRRRLAHFAEARGVACDAGAMAIAWRTAYAVSTFTLAATGAPFRPLREIQRENLEQVMAAHYPGPVTAAELDELTTVWDRLDPWPDTVEGLRRLKGLAIIAPMSNGNFIDMVNLARYAGLPWDIILGSSVARVYKPHPDAYLASIAALGLPPEEVCMVAAHQAELPYAAGLGMQTAFVARPEEFGGPVKPRHPEPGVDYLAAAEVHAEGDWTYVADSFIELAEQIRAS